LCFSTVSTLSRQLWHLEAIADGSLSMVVGNSEKAARFFDNLSRPIQLIITKEVCNTESTIQSMALRFGAITTQ
jgi:hypothetical protein